MIMFIIVIIIINTTAIIIKIIAIIIITIIIIIYCIIYYCCYQFVFKLVRFSKQIMNSFRINFRDFSDCGFRNTFFTRT